MILLCLLANTQNNFKISGKLSRFEESGFVKMKRQNCCLKNSKFELDGTFEETPNTSFFMI